MLSTLLSSSQSHLLSSSLLFLPPGIKHRRRRLRSPQEFHASHLFSLSFNAPLKIPVKSAPRKAIFLTKHSLLGRPAAILISSAHPLPFPDPPLSLLLSYRSWNRIATEVSPLLPFSLSFPLSALAGSSLLAPVRLLFLPSPLSPLSKVLPRVRRSGTSRLQDKLASFSWSFAARGRGAGGGHLRTPTVRSPFGRSTPLSLSFSSTTRH